MTGPARTLDANRPRARRDVAVAVVDGAAVIHHRGRVHALDPVATLVWKCCDGKASVAELAAELSDAFGAAPGAVQRDVSVAVAELAALDLLETSSTSVPAPAGALELLADPPGTCAACAERHWPARRTFRVGARLVEVGLDGPGADGADGAVMAALGAHLVTTPAAPAGEPPFLGVELHDRAGRRGPQPLDLLLRGDTVAARSRHPGRIVRALAAQLASYGDLGSLGLAPVNGTVVGREDRALIVAEPDDPPRFARALARAGVLVADQPVALVDPARGEVVVGAPGLSLGAAMAVSGTESVDGEPVPLPWGRYRVDAIAVAAPAGRSAALLAFGPRAGDHRDHDATVDALLALLDTVPVVDAVAPAAIGARLAG